MNKVLPNDGYNAVIKNNQHKQKIIWGNVIALGILHIAAVYGLSIKPNLTWSSALFGRFLAIVSTLSVTAGAHRLWSHRSYKANNIVQIFLIASMCTIYQNSIYTWCRDHRAHHKFSDTNGDPHNAKRGFFFSHVGWILMKKHPDVKKKGQTIDMSDLKANPLVMFQHKYYHFLVFLGFSFSTLVPMLFFGESFKIAFFTVTVYRYVISLNITWCINSLAHSIGYKPYDKNIGATHNMLMKYISFGEGFHNYHHSFPHDYNSSEYGNDVLNITTNFIDLMARIGWVTDRLRVLPEQANKKAQRSGDGTDGNNVLMGFNNKFIDALKDITLWVAFIVVL